MNHFRSLSTRVRTAVQFIRHLDRLPRTMAAVLLVVVGCGAFDSSNSVVFAATTYYVSPSGVATNDGSNAHPLDLKTALSRLGPVRPGDTVLVHGGVYELAANPNANGDLGIFYSNLVGTEAAPITIRQFPGEHATLNGRLASDLPVLVVESSYTWYWGFEITNSQPDRYVLRGTGLDVYGAHNHFINLVIHDVGQGVGFWATNSPDDSELYGSLIYNVGWEGPDRGHGHSVYVQNSSGFKRITNNILFNGFSFGIHAYAQNGRIDNIEVRDNIVFDHGILSVTGGLKANVLFAADTPAQSPTIAGNFAYYPAGSDGRDLDITYCNQGLIQGNYLSGGTPLKIYSCPNSSVTGNTIIGPVDGALQSTYSINSYSTTPSGVFAHVEANFYEPGRSHVVIYNWDHLAQVSVDLSAAGLANGDQFEVRDVQNYFGSPVLTGTYSGAVLIPMFGLPIAPVVGNSPVQPGHTGSEFGAFIVQRVSGTGAQTPTATFTASPFSITAGQQSSLTWSTGNATSASIDQGIGVVASSGSRVVSPSTTTTYTLSVAGSNGSTSRTATVTVTPALTSDGTMVPPAAQIVDSQGGIWTLGPNQAILRNGTLAAGGYGTKILSSGGSLYVFGLNGTWWKWLGSGWSSVGATQPGGTPTVSPTPLPASPDGTMVPQVAPQIVDSLGGTWTIGGGQAILLNGALASGGYGTKILWSSSKVYVFGLNGTWWQWSGSGWNNIGTTQPGGSTPTPAPTPILPATPAPASPDGTIVPPAPQVVDSEGATWTIGGSQAILRNGALASGGYGTKILWTSSKLYVFGLNGTWWQWSGSGWNNIGSTQPGVVTPPPTPTPTTTSADGTMVPLQATQIVDSQGGTWTIGGSQAILLNGALAAGGYGTKILWNGGSIYVLGLNNGWWKWLGSGWSNAGPTQPASSSTLTASVMVPQQAAQVTDGEGAVWSIGGSQAILRNGSLAAAGYGTKIFWTSGNIYVLGLNNTWWKWLGAGWTDVGQTQPN
jgi:hypothetical protein